MAVLVAEITRTLTDQHSWIKTLMETVVVHNGPQRQDAFSELCRFLAAHEAAEEECIHLPAMEELGGDIAVVDERRHEEDKAGEAITELERIGTDSPDFPDKFEDLRRTVIAHSEAEENQELRQLSGPLDDDELIRIQRALARVPELAGRDSQNGATFVEHRQAARAEFRSGTPTAR